MAPRSMRKVSLLDITTGEREVEIESALVVEDCAGVEDIRCSGRLTVLSCGWSCRVAERMVGGRTTL
jgi:hypothetical protein